MVGGGGKLNAYYMPGSMLLLSFKKPDEVGITSILLKNQGHRLGK